MITNEIAARHFKELRIENMSVVMPTFAANENVLDKIGIYDIFFFLTFAESKTCV